MLRRGIISLLLLAAFLPGKAETGSKADSLKNLIAGGKADTLKVFRQIELGNLLRNTDPQYALSLAEEALKLSKELKFRRGEARALQTKGSVLMNLRRNAEAMSCMKKALAMYEELGEKAKKAQMLHSFASIFGRQADYPRALEYSLKALDLYRELKNLPGQSNMLSNIANVYYFQGKTTEALEYYRQSLEKAEEAKDGSGISGVCNNLGNVYHDLGQYDKAREQYERCLKIDLENEDYYNAASAYGNLAFTHEEQKQYEKSLGLYSTGMEYAKKVNDERAYGFLLSGMGISYFGLGKEAEGFRYCLEGLEYAEKTGDYRKVSDVAKTLSERYEKKGRDREALLYFRKHVTAEDSLFNETRTREAAQIIMRRDYEELMEADSLERVQADLLHQGEMAQERLKGEQKEKLIWIFSAASVLMLGLCLLVFSQYRLKRKAHSEISNQKAIIEEKNKDILSSIHYAQRIQRALLASDQLLSAQLPEHFVLYLPKDIVSGDFYWAAETPGGHFMLLCGDCTGHGVPGAFMSLLGVTLLNEITIERRTTRPDEVLNCLRENLIRALGTGGETGMRDGMDAVFCRFNFSTQQLQFACANNPLWLIRGNELTQHGADKQPVGPHEGELRPFTLHEMPLKKGDCVYLFTDGYADQFGGAKGKKFKYRQLQELLLSIHAQPLDAQKRVLEETILAWRGKLEQIDDILIIGVRI